MVKQQEKWPGNVALGLQPDVCKSKNPKAIARFLKRPAEASRRRKVEPFHSCDEAI